MTKQVAAQILDRVGLLDMKDSNGGSVAAAVSGLEHQFEFGDFVWAKVKNNPWWPGQVYDPTDASELALKHRQEGRILVAFYGDGSCAWCLPSQLVPFAQTPGELWSDNASKSFMNAVQMASNEISRLMEWRILCRCVPSEKRGHLARPMASNAAARVGVLVPELGNDRLPILEYEPAEILAKVAAFARTGSFDSVFELAVFKGWVSAYYYRSFGSQLQVYSEPLLIEGMEDKSDGETTAVHNNSSCVMIVPYQGPEEEDWLSSPTGSSAKTKAPSVVKHYQRRKRKSVAGIMMEKERTVSPKTHERSAAKEAKEIGSMSRERKKRKSKYLSPPYTNDLHTGIGFSRYKPESEEDKSTTEDSQDLSASPVPESDDQTSAEMNDLAAERERAVDVDVEDFLQKLESGAVDCLFLSKEGHLDSVWGFMSAYRNSTYLLGSDYKKVSRKRKALSLASSSRSKPGGPADKSGTSRPTDDHLISGARLVRQNVDTMTAVLVSHSSRFSSDERACLKQDMEHLIENVENLGEKVRAMAEK